MGLLSTLALFPPYSLDTSILVAVLVGVVLLALLTESFGWVFVGLVVPGYLASVFVIHPEAGWTVVAEAVVTYGLAVLLAQGVRRTGAWSEFFGRDRFYLIVLASVLVRAVSEVALLPSLGAWADARYGTSFTADRSLHSIGLVLVPLTANAFWKLGPRRGAFQVGVPVLLTYAILRWVLLPGTNLSFSSLELTYEDVARDFLTSPKAYVILLTTALLAARFNLKYGWDFNGILVPALIALTWLEPMKLVATLVEVGVLVAATKLVLAAPGLRTLNLEGPRKTVLVFVLGFVAKWCLGWALGGRVPGLKVTDLFGFGYLVPTLLAVKILQKQVVARVMLATVHTSLAGFAVGSLVGFGLSLLEPRPAVAVDAAAQARAGAQVRSALGLGDSPLGVAALAHAAAREGAAEGRPLTRKRSELREYELLWAALDEWLERGGADAGVPAVRRRAQALGLELRALPGHPLRYALSERAALGERLGWDTALLVPGARGPVLEVPRPVSESPTAEAAVALCERVACRAVVISGVDSVRSGVPEGDVLRERRTPLRSAALALGGRARLQVRADARVPSGRPVLHVPAGVTAPGEALWPGAERVASAPPDAAEGWGRGGASVLRASPRDLAALAVQAAPGPAPASDVAALALELMRPAPARAPAAPTDEELVVLERQVAAPLLGTAGEWAGAPEPLRVQWAAAMASLMGLEVRPLVRAAAGPGPDAGCAAASRCWRVGDVEAQRGRLGAGLLLRTDGAPLALEAPAALQEAGTLPVALELWRSGNARALVYAEGRGGPAGTQAPVLTPGEPHTAFHAFHQAVHRALPADAGVILQVRGFSGREQLGADVVVSPDGPVLQPHPRWREVQALLESGGALSWLTPRVRYHDASPVLAGLTDASAQRSHARAFGGAHLATLWLSEPLRGAFLAVRGAEATLAQAGLAQALQPRSPAEALLGDGVRAPTGTAPAALARRFEALAGHAERLLVQQGVHELSTLAREGKAGRAQVRAYLSPEHGLPYLVVEARERGRVLRGLYFLQQHPAAGERVRLRAGAEGVEAQLEGALRRRAPVWVEASVSAATGAGRGAGGGALGGGR